MANSINTDKKKRKLFLKNFEKRNNLKKSIKNKNLTSFERYTAQIALQNMPRNSSKIRIKNRCILSGRTHGIDYWYEKSNMVKILIQTTFYRVFYIYLVCMFSYTCNI